MAAPNTKDLAWPLFDALVATGPAKDTNPWSAGQFAPDYTTLGRLLAVPLLLNANVKSGVPALALDVWSAYELRRAGLDPDWVWPRAEPPRVVSRDVLDFIASLPKRDQGDLLKRLRSKSTKGVASASANLLGKNYVKQVDVVMSSWATGPEVLISTKRMDSSFNNNAFNRMEESYGDAKNLRLRHPQAACGFLYALRSTAWDVKSNATEVGIAHRIVDLLTKLASEPDAYHACALIVPEYSGAAPSDSSDDATSSDDVEAPQPGPVPDDTEDVAAEQQVDVAAQIAALPEVKLRQDLVPKAVDSGAFFKVIVETVLSNSPVSYHQEARRRRGSPFNLGLA